RRENSKVEVAVVIIEGVGETYIQIWSEWRYVYVAGRPIQVGPRLISDHLGTGVIGRDRREHHSATRVLRDNVRRKIRWPAIKRIFEIKISYKVCLGGRG